MAHAIESRATSPANALRDALDTAERQVVAVDGTNVEAFLGSLDQIERLFTELAADKGDLRSEEVRWESLLNRIHSKPGPLVSAAAKAGGLAQLRVRHASATGFWWQLDQEVAQRRMQALKRAGITIGTIVAVVAFVLWAVNHFFPPDPTAVLITSATGDAQQLMMDQKWPEALQAIQKALKTLPNEPELLIWEGVLYEQLGQAAPAKASLNHAQHQLQAQPLLYWLQLGNTRLQVGNLAGADQAAQQGLSLAPDDPQANFLIGNIAEAQGDTIKAVEVFSRTFALAEKSNPQLAVIARVRMGNLLQRVNPFATAAPITTTTAISP
jgi:tetratricopeptide (TPR) repeat protein